MQYKSLNQSQIRVISTIDTTINISNDLTKLDWGRFSGPPVLAVQEAIPTTGTQIKLLGPDYYGSEYTTASSSATSFAWIPLGSGNLPITEISTANAPVASYTRAITIDGVTYTGTAAARFCSSAIKTANNNVAVHYVAPKGKLTVIKYDSAAQTIITEEENYGGNAYTTVTPPASKYSAYQHTIALYKNANDIILGTFFEVEPITVTKNLTGCTATDNTTNNQYNFGQPYKIEVKPTADHTLTGSTISFTADGETIPSTAYTWDETDGICTINPIYVSNALTVNVTCPVS